MAKNGPRGGGRVGAIKKRNQAASPRNKRWTKRSLVTGEFMDQKADAEPFKSVRKSSRSRRAA